MFNLFFLTFAVLLILVILLQQKSSGLGSMMGGGDNEELVSSRRGADKFLHYATIILSTLFVGMAAWKMFL
jgi:protein translocase SecG subunit